MSFAGVSSAHVYVQQKRQIEKLKRMEEERARLGRAVIEEKLVGDQNGNIKKIYPDNFPSPGVARISFGQARDNAYYTKIV